MSNDLSGPGTRTMTKSLPVGVSSSAEAVPVFGQILSIGIIPGTVIFLAMLAMIVSLEYLFRILEALSEHWELERLIMRLKEQILILGLLSFVIFIIVTKIDSGVLYEYGRESDWYKAFQLIHSVFFFMVVAFFIQAIFFVVHGIRSSNFHRLNVRISASSLYKIYQEMVARDKRHHDDCRKKMDDPTFIPTIREYFHIMLYRTDLWVWKHIPRFVYYTSFGNALEMILLDRLFLTFHAVPASFRFSRYVRIISKNFIADSTRVTPWVWFVLSILVVINLFKSSVLDPLIAPLECGYVSVITTNTTVSNTHAIRKIEPTLSPTFLRSSVTSRVLDATTTSTTSSAITASTLPEEDLYHCNGYLLTYALICLIFLSLFTFVINTIATVHLKTIVCEGIRICFEKDEGSGRRTGEGLEDIYSINVQHNSIYAENAMTHTQEDENASNDRLYISSPEALAGASIAALKILYAEEELALSQRFTTARQSTPPQIIPQRRRSLTRLDMTSSIRDNNNNNINNVNSNNRPKSQISPTGGARLSITNPLNSHMESPSPSAKRRVSFAADIASFAPEPDVLVPDRRSFSSSFSSGSIASSLPPSPNSSPPTLSAPHSSTTLSPPSSASASPSSSPPLSHKQQQQQQQRISTLQSQRQEWIASRVAKIQKQKRLAKLPLMESWMQVMQLWLIEYMESLRWPSGWNGNGEFRRPHSLPQHFFCGFPQAYRFCIEIMVMLQCLFMALFFSQFDIVSSAVGIEAWGGGTGGHKGDVGGAYCFLLVLLLIFSMIGTHSLIHKTILLTAMNTASHETIAQVCEELDEEQTIISRVRHLFSETLSTGPSTTSLTLTLIRARFNDIDITGSGQLNKREYYSFLASLSIPLTPYKFERLWAATCDWICIPYEWDGGNRISGFSSGFLGDDRGWRGGNESGWVWEGQYDSHEVMWEEVLILLVPQWRREYRDSFPIVQLVQRFILEGKKGGLVDFDKKVEWSRTRSQIDQDITQTFEKYDTDHDELISFSAFFLFLNELLHRTDINRRQFNLLLACVCSFNNDGGMAEGGLERVGTVHLNEFKSLVFGPGWSPPSPPPSPLPLVEKEESKEDNDDLQDSQKQDEDKEEEEGVEEEEEEEYNDEDVDYLRQSMGLEASRESFSVINNAAFNALKKKAVEHVPSPERKQREEDWFAGYYLHDDEKM